MSHVVFCVLDFTFMSIFSVETEKSYSLESNTKCYSPVHSITHSKHVHCHSNQNSVVHTFLPHIIAMTVVRSLMLGYVMPCVLRESIWYGLYGNAIASGG
jgi:hypothetical protein